MRTINLDSTSKSLEIKLNGAVITNQLDWTCSWYDTTIADGTILEGITSGTTNDTTAVTVCAAPASGHTRTVKCITIYNADTVNATPIVQLNDNSYIRVIYRNMLTTLSSVSLDDMSIITDISGKVDGPASTTNENIAVFDGTTGKLIKDGGVTIASLQLSKASGSDVDTGTDDAKYVTSKAIEDSGVTQNTKTQTLTNKRINPRITTITSHATPTINTDNCDAVTITAQAEAITSMTTNLSGTPVNFQKLIIRIKDNGIARIITWGASFEAKGQVLPTTTVINKVLTVGFIYDSVTSKWGCVAVAQE